MQHCCDKVHDSISPSDYDTSTEAFEKSNTREKDEHSNPMERTSILCFPSQSAVTLELLKEREKLSPKQIEELDKVLAFFLANKGKFGFEQALQFNKVSGLYVNFKCGPHFYAIEFKFDGRDVFFEASYRMFNSRDYDSDDEEDKKMTSYVFVPFERLYPVKTPKGEVLTISMYFDFVVKCLTMKDADHVYRDDRYRR